MTPSLNRRSALKIVASFSAVTAFSACGNSTNSSTVASQASASVTETSNANDVGSGNPSLFDGASHEVKISVSEDDLATILNAYQQDSSKEWVSANITIDGTLIEKVGIRLKGNSTLRGLSSDGQNAAPGGATDTNLDVNDASTWPFLIGFDKNVEDRVFQNHTRLSLRPGSPLLNEALALSMTAATGQPSQEFTYIKYTLNNLPSATRLMLVVPDEAYGDALGDGILYKADADGSFSYQGDDESTYAEQFKQINGDDNLQPIIRLLQWVDSASDEEFDAELGKYVDVESFARYVATQNLIVNADDMAGPGKNYYLWYDNATGLFSIISWDLNMAMSGDTSPGPDDMVSMGGGAPGGNAPGGAMPADGLAQTPPDAAGAGKMIQGNTLKTRFLASSAFAETYHAAYWDLYSKIYSGKQALTELEKIVSVVPATDSLPQTQIDEAKATLSTWVEERNTALEALKS